MPFFAHACVWGNFQWHTQDERVTQALYEHAHAKQLKIHVKHRKQSNSDSCLRYAIVVHMYFNFSALSFLHEFYKDIHKFCPDRAGCSYACNYQDSCQPVLLQLANGHGPAYRTVVIDNFPQILMMN